MRQITLGQFHEETGDLSERGELTVLLVISAEHPRGVEWPIHLEWNLPPGFEGWEEMGGTATPGRWEWDGRGPKLLDWNGGEVYGLRANRYQINELPEEILEWLSEVEDVA